LNQVPDGPATGPATSRAYFTVSYLWKSIIWQRFDQGPAWQTLDILDGCEKRHDNSDRHDRAE